MKIGRNQTCPCGSGLKFKKCCGSYAAGDQAPASDRTADIQHAFERHRADERIREQQQGFGRPIVAFKANDQQLVAVGMTLYHSPSWKTFPDFLADYIKQVLDPAWGNAELAKPFAERHPVIQWYDACCRYQQSMIKTAGEPTAMNVTGVVACYLGLAYSLYLIKHNVELQERLVRRLRIVEQFQGAYYELVVANILIRAGFELTLEDETDGKTKHCEYAAVSKRTGKKYWVEAKMRSVAGLLGKTQRDGTTDMNPLNRLIPQLNDALAKPAADERLIFIDLNTEQIIDAAGKPPWIENAAKRLEQYEKRELAPGLTAHLFVTNFASHRFLNDQMPLAAFPFGLGLPDLNRPGTRRVSEAYRLKQKYIDMHHIGEAILSYGRFPTTFDGSLPSEALQGRSRAIIGETYSFGDPAKGGRIGRVTSACVDEDASEAWYAIVDPNGNSSLVKEPMSADELADYRAHKDSYFGRVRPVGRKTEDPFELFESFVESHNWITHEQLLNNLAGSPDIETLRALSRDDLLYEYCERMVASAMAQSKQAS